MTVLVRAEDVTAAYGAGSAVLRSVTVTISDGITALLGPNGAGKTSLFRALAGVIAPSSGRIERSSGLTIGYVGHRIGLAPRLTAREYFAYWEKIDGPTPLEADALRRIEDALGIAELLDVHCGSLSRGQSQRVGIAGAVRRGSTLLLLDEPTAGLDPIASRSFKVLLRRIADEGISSLVSTHNLTEVTEIADRVIMLVEGRVADDRHVRDIIGTTPQTDATPLATFEAYFERVTECAGDPAHSDGRR